MSGHNRILAALLGLAALPLFLACDDGPTAVGGGQMPVQQENAVKVIPEWNFIAVGESTQLRVILPGRGDKGAYEPEALEWESSDPAIVTVEAGEVRGLKPGHALITARYDGNRGSAHVNVRNPRPAAEEPEELAG